MRDLCSVRCFEIASLSPIDSNRFWARISSASDLFAMCDSKDEDYQFTDLDIVDDAVVAGTDAVLAVATL